jgi:signal transduction histidine kinase
MAPFTETATRRRPEAVAPDTWLGPLVYLVVLTAGFLADPGSSRSTIVFVGCLVTLTALDLLAAADPRTFGQPGAAAALLVVRVLLYVVVATVDESGSSRLLFLLVPFYGWTAFGAVPGLALGAGTLASLPAWLARRGPDGPGDPVPNVSDLLMFFVGLVVTCALAALMVRERRARASLGRAGEVIAELSAESERQRLVREVHDGVAHHLTATAIQLEKAKAFRAVDPAVADAAVDDARAAVGRALEEVREALTGIRGSESAASVPRDTTLADLAREVEADSRALVDEDLSVEVEVRGDPAQRLDPAVAAGLRGIAREALTNTRRHAGAGAARVVRARVVLDVGSARVTLEVTDDGRGFVVSQFPGHGLTGMRERAESCGGHLDVSSRSPTGTRIVARLPVRSPAPPPYAAEVGA